MDLELSGRRALVLGSSAGMGRAIATRLAAEGAAVFVTGRDAERCAACAAAIGAAGWLAADLTVGGMAESLVSEAALVLGGLDILVGNTGGGRPGGMLQADEAAVDDAYRKMLVPQLAAMRAAIPHLRRRGSGRIVALTARSILEATPDLALSSVFRGGVAAAARSLAIELAPDVTVNVVVPGQFDTASLSRFEAVIAEMESTSTDEVRRNHLAAIPMGRLGLPEEIGDLVAFLASARAGYITGATIRIDGGLTRGF